MTCLLYMGIDSEGHKLLAPVCLVAEAKRCQLKYLASQVLLDEYTVFLNTYVILTHTGEH